MLGRFGVEFLAIVGGGCVLLKFLAKLLLKGLIEDQRAQNEKDIALYKAELNKELEKLKSANERINCISKIQFGVELKIYQKLSEKFYAAVLDTSQLFPVGSDMVNDNEEIMKQKMNDAHESIMGAQCVIYKYAPFVPENIQNSFLNLFTLMKELYGNYISLIQGRPIPDNNLLAAKTTQMLEDHKTLLNEIRKYLSSLKVDM